MDFIDPQKRRAHQVRLLIGYCLVAIAVVLATIVLIYRANGFGFKQGKVIQNGLVFVQARPGAANVNLNGLAKGTTDARLTLEAGSYTMRLSRDGYHDWQRALTVEGGSVEHFTYPMLVPKTLTSAKLNSYQAAPALATQSPDRRWMLVQQPGQLAAYDMYDLRDPAKVGETRQTVAIPAAVLTLPAASPQTIEVVEWSNDNDHALLRHASGDKFEYIMFSRKAPAASVNLTKSLQLTPNLALSLQDKKYDQYFVHDTTTNTLSRASLSKPQAVPLLTNVLAFKTYGDDIVLYVSAVFGQPDKVQVKLYADQRQYVIRNLAASPPYLLALSRYDGSWMVAAGVASENRVYVYRSPDESLRSEPNLSPASIAVLKVTNPSAVAFSTNSQLVMAQGNGIAGSSEAVKGPVFAVYDAEYDRSHTFTIDSPMDAPQLKASWLDTHHLTYVSGGKVVIVDYDGTNLRTLASQLPGVTPLYDTGYVTMYTLAQPAAADPAKPEAIVLSATPLRTPADQ